MVSKLSLMTLLMSFFVQAAGCATRWRSSNEDPQPQTSNPPDGNLYGGIRRADQEEIVKKLQAADSVQAFCLFSMSGWVDDGQYCFVVNGDKKTVFVKKPAAEQFVEADALTKQIEAINRATTAAQNLKDFKVEAFDNYKYEYLIWKKNAGSSIARERLLAIDGLHLTPKEHQKFLQDFKTAFAENTK